jgi:hypothetical protein
MSTERTNQHLVRWNSLSERLFGAAADVTAAEAEELLKTAGIDPTGLKDSLFQRLLERAERYSGAGRPVPPVLQRALEDLQPASGRKVEEATVSRTAQLAIARLLREIAELPERMSSGIAPTFTAAYRDRKELSARDNKILDEVAQELQERIRTRRPETHE